MVASVDQMDTKIPVLFSGGKIYVSKIMIAQKAVMQKTANFCV